MTKFLFIVALTSSIRVLLKIQKCRYHSVVQEYLNLSCEIKYSKKAVRHSIHTVTEEILEKIPTISEIITTGHSLGGALAVLCAYDLSKSMREGESEKEEQDSSTNVENREEDFEIGEQKEPFVPKGHEDHIHEPCKGFFILIS